MMVLRHLIPSSAATPVRERESLSPEDDRPTPMDLSNKHQQRHSDHAQPFPYSLLPPSAIRPRSSPTQKYLNNNNNLSNNNNNNINDLKCSSPQSSTSGESSPVRGWKMRRKDIPKKWREHVEESSPDSGMHGEEEEIRSLNDAMNSPPLSSGGRKPMPMPNIPQSLIPLSIIKARYSQGPETPEGGGKEKGVNVNTKRARLEEMVSHIKTTKSRSRRNSGEEDEDTSSGGHDAGTSSDEITEEGCVVDYGGGRRSVSHVMEDEDDGEQPCNLSNKSRGEKGDLSWKKSPSPLSSATKPLMMDSLSPVEAAKLLGLDPEGYQQQMMQLQLTSAAMMGDLKGMGSYPPWVYLNYYSQILQSYQAQEILRQYAMQSNNGTTPLHNASVSPEERGVPLSKSCLGTPRYSSQSPLSPASLSEGPGGMDSDGSTVGHSTPGSANNGKRAPRAMTGRHVRTGTGASPSTLQTLRQKIEERQRIKAQQARNESLSQSNSKLKNSGNSSSSNKSAKKYKK